MKYQIAILEDNQDYRENLEEYILNSKQFDLCGTYSTAEAAYSGLKNRKCDLALVDIGLPGMSGVEFIYKIKKTSTKLQPIVISVFDDSETVFDALKAGAVGYLTKNLRQDELISALHTTLKGGAPMSPVIARKVVRSFELSIESPLSTKEAAVLKHLAHGFSYSQIAEKVFVSGETIKSHIKNIYRKLEVNSKSEAIEKGLQDRLI